MTILVSKSGLSHEELVRRRLLSINRLPDMSSESGIAGGGDGDLLAANLVVRETPSGTLNGSNTVFILANTPEVGTEEIFLNGVLMNPGSGNDYQISGATITFEFSPVTGGKILVNYRKA